MWIPLFFLFGLGRTAIEPATNVPPSQKPLSEIKLMLSRQKSELGPEVIQNVLTTLECAKKAKIEYGPILTVIDYALPSNKKRMWVFNLNKNQLIFHTYVTHGINSGDLFSHTFSNKFNSKSSSIGVFDTENSYYGRHGLSLKLVGLDRNINDNAYGRSIVMHGAWYVTEEFIKKYGRAGRSWGCPAIPENLTKPIIDTIKGNNLMVAYHPSDVWIQKSKFLTCEKPKELVKANITTPVPIVSNEPEHEPILFADLKGDNKHTESDPVLTIPADLYQQIYKKKAPLERMLRRQINNTEYVALSEAELKSMDPTQLRQVSFVVPNVKMVRGYYATEMQVVNFGEMTGVNTVGSRLIANFQKHPAVMLHSTPRFIRWLGL